MSPLSKKNHSSQAGFSTLVLVFYLLFIFVSLAGAMATVVLVSKRQYATNLGARRAYYGAESYINRALFKIMVGGDWPTSGSYAGGSVVIEAEAEKFTISHISPKAKRTLEVTRGETPGAPGQNVALMLILDCTGSMSDKVDGGDRRMKKAKDAVKSFLGELEADTRFDEDSSLIGLMTFEVDQLYYQDPHLVPASADSLQVLIDKVDAFGDDPDNQEDEGDGYCRGYHDHGFTNTAGTIFYATKTHKDLNLDTDFVSFNILVTDGIPSGVWLPTAEAGSCQENDKEDDDDKAVEKLNCLSDNILPNYSTRQLVVVIDKNAPSGNADKAFANLTNVGTSDAGTTMTCEEAPGCYFDANALNLDQVLSQVKDEILTGEVFHLHEIEPEAD